MSLSWWYLPCVFNVVYHEYNVSNVFTYATYQNGYIIWSMDIDIERKNILILSNIGKVGV